MKLFLPFLDRREKPRFVGVSHFIFRELSRQAESLLRTLTPSHKSVAPLIGPVRIRKLLAGCGT